jgi:hypothetical protein
MPSRIFLTFLRRRLSICFSRITRDFRIGTPALVSTEKYFVNMRTSLLLTFRLPAEKYSSQVRSDSFLIDVTVRLCDASFSRASLRFVASIWPRTSVPLALTPT